MAVDDKEPRFQLADADGNVVGSLYWNGSSLVFQEGTNQTEVALNENGLLDLLDVQGSMPLYYEQETEPSETPSPPPEGPGGVWAETIPPGEIVWTYKSGAEGGGIYKESQDTLIYGDDSNAIHAIDPSDGSKNWVYTGANTVNAPPNPIGDKDMVVCTSGQGVMYAFEVSTGIKKWEYNASDTYINYKGVYAPNDELAIHGDGDGTIYAVNISDGTQSWSAPGPSGSYDVQDGTYASAEDLAVFTYYTGELHALNPTDGSVAWTYTGASGEGSDGAIYVADENLVVFANPGGQKVHAVNASDGTKEWTYDIGVWSVVNAVWIEDKDLVIGAAGSNVFALNASDGSEVWKTNTGYGAYSRNDWIESEDLFVTSASNDAYNGPGEVFAFDTGTGEIEWSYALDSGSYMGARGSMVAVEKHNIVATPGMELYNGEWHQAAISYTDKTIENHTSDGTNWG